MNRSQVLRLVFCISFLCARVAYAEDPPNFALKWGTLGVNPGQFQLVHDVQCDAQGNVYVADTGNHRIQKFTGNGIFLAELHSAASGPASFGDTPSCTVDIQGNLYVSDNVGHSIDVFDPHLAYVRSWPATAGYLRLSPDNSRLYSLEGDTLITYDVATGTRLLHWRLTLQADLGFGVGTSGNLYFSAGAYIAKFTPTGMFLGSLGDLGGGNGEFAGGGGVTCDPQENVYGGDTSSRIQKFTSDGGFLSSWGSEGTGDGQFGVIIPSIACDTGGNIFVVDAVNHRIQKFVYTSTPTRATSWGQLKRQYR